ncbi:MAG: molybdopterin molybdenumtransferase MoeA [Rhodomicrobium sp.]|nr:MAG: molybdopterin molybdenumtransferase MoeA [Rhodomicrobium sp.]
MATHLINDCFLHDKDRLTHHEALDILKKNITPVTTAIEVALADATGLVLAEDINAPRPIPGHTNAAVDGYAFAYKAYDAAKGSSFIVQQRVTAGEGQIETANTKAAARIFTGAVMPTAYDSTVMQEDVTLKEDENGTQIVTIPAGLKPGANVRKAGEDTKQGGLLAGAATRLTPAHIAAIASGGIGKLSCFRKLRVAILSTGNEVIPAGAPFSLGKVYNANGPMLAALLKSQKIEITDLGIIPDQAELINQTISEAAKHHDVIISSGGASKGEEDHIITTLNQLGHQHMWQLAIKPGRPMSFGQIKDTVFIGLPGNPVAAFICYCLYAAPMLRRLGGENWWQPISFEVPADFEITNKKPDRREFIRGNLHHKNGETWVSRYKQDGSGLIRSLTQSNAIIEIDEATTSLQKGDKVRVLPFSNWGL